MTGLSKSHISQIENGKISPSVSSLVKIGNALRFPMSSFFEIVDINKKYLVKRDERKKFSVHSSDIVYELLSTDLKGRMMEASVIRFKKGARTGKGDLYSYEGEQVGLLLKGKLEINLNGEIIIMEEGDSIYFRSSIPHSGRNIGDGEAIAVWVITPPNF